MPGDSAGRIRSELTEPKPRWSWPDFGAKARAPQAGPVWPQPHPSPGAFFSAKGHLE